MVCQCIFYDTIYTKATYEKVSTSDISKAQIINFDTDSSLSKFVN